MSAAEALLNYASLPAGAGPRVIDLRSASTDGTPLCAVRCRIADARTASNIGLDRSGFELLEAPSQVVDWRDVDEVMRVYYAECRALATRLTGASHTFTFDHLLRENNRQIAGGGLDPAGGATGPRGGGGFIHSVHMDYTARSVWQEYLALHGITEPRDAERVVVLNFWRPLVDVVRDNALAVCDARSVRAEDLTEAYIYGYGPSSYSWHDIGISTYSVRASPRHCWYHYPHMRRDEVLVMRSFDSAGVIGRCCPHTAFADVNAAGGSTRRSIELRVLCFIGARDG